MNVLKMLKLSKRGQTFDLGTKLALGVMVFIFVVFAILYGIATLNPASFFTANSISANATTNLQNNLTAGISTFGSYIPTIFTILAVVIVLGFILLLVLVAKKMAAGNGTSGGLG